MGLKTSKYFISGWGIGDNDIQILVLSKCNIYDNAFPIPIYGSNFSEITSRSKPFNLL